MREKNQPTQHEIYLVNLMNNSSHNNNNDHNDDDNNDEMNVFVHTILKLDSLRLINWLAFIPCE